MTILQISAPKTGSYWLYRVLNQVVKKKGLDYSTFIQQQPIYEAVKKLSLSFEEQTGVDMLNIEEEGCYYRISSLFKHPIKDLDQFLHSASLVWTHSTLCRRSFHVLPKFDKRVFILRDPRDRALSSALFAFTPYMRRYYPVIYSSPREFLEAEFERLIEQWVWYVGNYLLYKEELDIHFVFYERLLHDFDQELQSLLDYLEIHLKENEKQEIAKNVSFSNMKRNNPDHLHKGSYGKWIHHLSQEQKQTAQKIAGDLMDTLHYPRTEDPRQLPTVPKKIPDAPLRANLKQIDWYRLFQETASAI